MLRIQTLKTSHKYHAVGGRRQVETGGRHSFHPPASNCGQLLPKGCVDNCDEPRTKLGAFFSSRQKNAMLAYVTVELYWSVIPRS
jgi:hypothetical protein